VNFGFGVLAAGGGAGMTYGVVGLTIVPLDALGVRWNAGSAAGCLAAVAALMAAAVARALNIKHVVISSPVVQGFVLPDGLGSLDKSTSWAKIYDNGGARIYQWRGSAGTRKGA